MKLISRSLKKAQQKSYKICVAILRTLGNNIKDRRANILLRSPTSSPLVVACIFRSDIDKNEHP